jgi:hypothetical protein
MRRPETPRIMLPMIMVVRRDPPPDVPMLALLRS